MKYLHETYFPCRLVYTVEANFNTQYFFEKDNVDCVPALL
jgi:hypothetical protein